MLSFLKKLFGPRPAEPVLRIIDADFGPIQYCEPSEKYAHGGYWQMEGGWSVSWPHFAGLSPSIHEMLVA
jgi:hypothetical protein